MSVSVCLWFFLLCVFYIEDANLAHDGVIWCLAQHILSAQIKTMITFSNVYLKGNCCCCPLSSLLRLYKFKSEKGLFKSYRLLSQIFLRREGSSVGLKVVRFLLISALLEPSSFFFIITPSMLSVNIDLCGDGSIEIWWAIGSLCWSKWLLKLWIAFACQITANYTPLIEAFPFYLKRSQEFINSQNGSKLWLHPIDLCDSIPLKVNRIDCLINHCVFMREFALVMCCSYGHGLGLGWCKTKLYVDYRPETAK